MFVIFLKTKNSHSHTKRLNGNLPMSTMFRPIIGMCLAGILSGCASSGYQDYYTAHVEASQFPNDANWLKDEEEPQHFTSSDLETDTLIMRSRNYGVVGYSAFNGVYEDVDHAIT